MADTIGTDPCVRCSTSSGKVALVTGGSRGLGREMVLGLRAAGADVVIASRKLDACEALAREVAAATGRRALPSLPRGPLGGGRRARRRRLRPTSARRRAGEQRRHVAAVRPRRRVSEELYDKVLA